VLRTPAFWLMTLSVATSLGVSNTLVATLVPLARDNGASMLEATSLLSVMGGGARAAGQVFAAVADTVDPGIQLSCLFMLGLLLNALLLYDRSYPAMAAGAALLGVGTGTITPTFYALLADRFGTRSFGTVRGLSMLIMSGLAMVLVRFGGEVFDRTGGYELMFAIFIALQFFAAALMLANRLDRGTAARPSPA
jgi:MFS family permease